MIDTPNTFLGILNLNPCPIIYLIYNKINFLIYFEGNKEAHN